MRNIIFIILIIICLTPIVSPGIALILGILSSLLKLQNSSISKYRSLLLQASIVLMGFGMNLSEVIKTSQNGFYITVISVFGTLAIGILLGKILKVDKTTSLLISSGTAICGGSAIAAVSPILNAKDYQISFSMVVVFALNAIALFIFPAIGKFFNLGQEEFGLWAAIAIHDTSSVIGAGANYGESALKVATIVKLTRALWIIPISLLFALKNRTAKKEVKIPWFIFLFIIAIIIAHLTPSLNIYHSFLDKIGKQIMIVAIFLIGSSLSINQLKETGSKSFIHGIILWIFISVFSFIFLFY